MSVPYWLKNELGQEHPVAYFAKKVMQRETKFSTVKRECLRVLLALKNFERYILGVPVTIITTDHNYLKWLLIMSPHNSRLLRWAYVYKDITDVIKYKPGVTHTDADRLSSSIA